MNCPRCYKEIGKLKKNKLYSCQCGAELLAVEINKKLVVEDLSKDKGEK